MFKRLILMVTMMAVATTMAFAQPTSVKKKTLHKQEKQVIAKSSSKQTVKHASKKSKKSKKTSRAA